MEQSTIIKGVTGGGVAFVSYLFGAFDLTLQILVTFMAIDYITGVLKGAKKGELSPQKGLEGIQKKFYIMIMVVIAVQLDKLVGQNNLFRWVVSYYYIGNEGISALDNIATAGIPLPTFLVKALKSMRDNADKGAMNNEG